MNFRLPDSHYCVLLGNGQYPDISLCQTIINNSDFIICSDGGANFARKNNITPNLIIGDLDSISQETQDYFTNQNVTVLPLESQKENDLEKALNYITAEHTFQQIVLLGFLGLRDDHSFATLQVAEKFTDPKIIRIYSSSAVYLVLSPGDYKLEFPQKHTVSVFALPYADNVYTTGMRWNFEHEKLKPGSAGVSNVALNPNITISFDTGRLLLIYSY